MCVCPSTFPYLHIDSYEHSSGDKKNPELRKQRRDLRASHRSGPPSGSTPPTPHTGSITRPLRITAWHRTRVCPLCTFGSVDFLLPREHGDAGGLRNSVGHFGLYCAVEAKDGGLFSAV